jgi:hypothetical protein
MKRSPSQDDLYCLRETMRTTFAKQVVPGKEERIFLDRVFANLRFLGDNLMLRNRLINEFSDEVDILADRYMDKPIDADSGRTFTRRIYEDVRVGNCAAIFLLARCILHNNPTPLSGVPDWVDDAQLTTEFVDSIHSSSSYGYKELKSLSFMIYQMPLALDIDENEKKFLYLLLSRLYLIADPRGLRCEVVKKVDFNALSKRYVKSTSNSLWCFCASDIALGKSGQSEALLKLAWQILGDNHQRLFPKP